jgi:hypothetical protein
LAEFHKPSPRKRPVMPPTGSSWIAVALISASVVHAARGPSPLTVRLIVGHGAGVSGEPRPGRPDAAGTRGRLLDGRLPTGCLETRGDPGQAEGYRPRNHPASQASAGGQAPGTSRRSPPVRSRSPGRSKVRLPGMSAPCHAVTLSDTGRHGERAHCRRSGVRHERERRRVLSLITESSARMFPGGEPWQAGRDLAPGLAALGAGHGLVGRAIGRGPAGGMMR